MKQNKHILTLTSPVYHPGEGFLLGNGDISASMFSRNGDLVIRLGKNDLWDDRLDLSRIHRPADIEELRELILNEKFHCDGPSGKLDLNSCDNPRVLELCTKRGLDGTSPNPKPAAELLLHTCGDLHDMHLEQKLVIESGLYEAVLSWDNGIRLELSAAVHPEKNILALNCRTFNYHGQHRFGGEFYGIVKPYLFFFELKRPDEKSAFDSVRENLPQLTTNGLPNNIKNSEPLLPPAEYSLTGNIGHLRQKFPGTVMDMAISGENMEISADRKSILLLPSDGSGSVSLLLNWETGREPELTGTDKEEVFQTARQAAEDFFRISQVRFQEKGLEELYYATMHAKRCSFKSGKFPPGLLLSSTINDYSSWHGDYHLNYNYQSAFLGDFASGHFDTGDAFFTGLAPLLKLGRKIARDYYHCRGCFVQLSGFPFEVADDYMGHLPFGRMAYMTGWVAAWFYRRWDLSGDMVFLKEQAYPALRDFALFYTDFLTLEADGMYHAFPSNQGEEDYTLAGTRDQVQVLRHARGALNYALECAGFLDCDHELQKQWKNILDNLVPVGELPPFMAAEFAGFDGRLPAPPEEFLMPGTKHYDWYPGQMPYFFATALRNGLYQPEKYEEHLITFLKRWQLPNKLLQAMAATHYGHEGYWSEGLGIAGALLDMLAVNCKGVLTFFGGVSGDAAFENLLLDGGFICSGSKEDRAVKKLTVAARHDRKIKIKLPENFSGKTEIISQDGTSSIFTATADNIITVTIQKGGTINLFPVSKK
ncbi:MAG: hypothetical protein E7043_04280 [Lentisphaerae bacterium]|nr:hypothetical protein [Lentisphaerota bacterium]